MSNIYFTSDTHFGHANIIKFCNRPFLSEEELITVEQDLKCKISREAVERMNQALIDNINRIVKRDDILWHLGDFCWGGYKEAKTYRDQINCRNVNLIWGNHDEPEIRPLFNEAYDRKLIKVGNQPIILDHYPILSWNGSYHGCWHLFGHVHGNLSKDPLFNAVLQRILSLDVGVDGYECDGRMTPWAYEEIEDHIKKKIPLWQRFKAV